MKTTINILIMVFVTSSVFSQISEQTIKYRNDEYGDVKYRKESNLEGNRIRSIFFNNGEIGQWPFQPSGEWPKGSGQSYFDGFALLVAAEVKAPGNGAYIHPVETSYREWMDKDPTTGQIWGLEPLPGYSNPNSTNFAISTNPQTWPQSWPTALPNVDESWNGFWYGYFGRGILNADFESFFVMDDSKDHEFTRPPYNYYPISTDHNRGGLGLRIETRTLNWSDKNTKNVSFWHYEIINISDSNYNKMVSGFYIDPAIGGSWDNQDDMVGLDKFHDIVYCFDYNGLGSPGDWATGYMGVAFLETASNEVNGIDDDNDGMVDESRSDGIDNDGDWQSYSDLNNNGIWDTNEPLNDDLGADGIGPESEYYNGTDIGEGDGFPTNGEPNFDKTDLDESDMIGLTSTSVYRLGDGGSGGGWPKDDEELWLKMKPDNFSISLQNANISLVMSSGPYKLDINGSQRISSALVFAIDLDELLINKIVAQDIYNNNYLISKEEPFSLIYPASGDTVFGNIDILWNKGECAERNALARIYISKEDGDYELIGEDSTNSGVFSFNSEAYTDGIFYKLKILSHDGILCGEAETKDYFVINNSLNSAPQFRFISLKKENYNKSKINIKFLAGDADGDPATISLYYGSGNNYDNSKRIFLNQPDTLSEYIWNTFEIANGSDYFLFGKIQTQKDFTISIFGPFSIENNRSIINGSTLITSKTVVGTGNFYLSLVNPNDIKPNTYKIEFIDMTDSNEVGYNLFDISKQQYVYQNAKLGLDREGSLFNGLRLSIYDDTLKQVIDSLTSWQEGECNIPFEVSLDESSPSRNIHWPVDFQLTFMAENYYTTPFFNLASNLKITNLSANSLVDYEIFDKDGNKALSIYDDIVIIKDLVANFKLTWNVRLLPPRGIGITPQLPVPGDVFQIITSKKFKAGEEIIFNTEAIVGVNETKVLKESLELSQNYPNPFNPVTTIQYKIPSATIKESSQNNKQLVKLSIHDILGREIKILVNKHQYSGSYEVQFDASNLSSGVYFYRLIVGEIVISKKMILLR